MKNVSTPIISFVILSLLVGAGFLFWLGTYIAPVPPITPTGTSPVLVYFSNRLKDLQALECEKVYPVERQVTNIQKDMDPLLVSARAAITQLLLGPNEEERTDGYFTSINEGVQIQSLVIMNGEARVDFDERLGEQVAGSCRVGAIRAQIEQTLLQFPQIQKVVISINGNSEEVLQP